MKKLIIALSIFLLSTTSLMAASQYDGIWVIKDLQVTKVDPPDARLSSDKFEKGPTEQFALLTKYGMLGIIIVLDQPMISSITGLFRMHGKELEAEIHPLLPSPCFQCIFIPEETAHVIQITFIDTKTARYKRVFTPREKFIEFTHSPPPDWKPPISFTVEGTLQKVAEPFD